MIELISGIMLGVVSCMLMYEVVFPDKKPPVKKKPDTTTITEVYKS